ncbi:MAG: UDP-N-acetylmuramate dehydrogenase [Bacillota bacterium]
MTCFILRDAPLEAHNTFRVPARALRYTELREAAALPELLARRDVQGMPLLPLGEGSNLLFTKDFQGLVLHVANRGVRVLKDGASARVRVAAGENWDSFVRWSLEQGLCGLENLTLIPGNVGAAPIQNIGAYGVEVREFISSVEAWDMKRGEFVQLDNADCGFAYRDSVFKRDPHRFVVTAVDFELPRDRPLRLAYAGVQEELDAMGIADPKPVDVSLAVETLRRRKLPDPAITGNAGSFFKNPVVPEARANALLAAHPKLPNWPAGEGQMKLSGAWLIEACGFKGVRDGDAGVSDKHSLVLINYSHATGAQVWALAQRIRDTVHNRFGVSLEPEPIIL